MSNRNIIFSLEVVESFGSNESRTIQLGGKFLSEGMLDRTKELQPMFNAFSDHYGLTSKEVLALNEIVAKAYQDLSNILRVE